MDKSKAARFLVAHGVQTTTHTKTVTHQIVGLSFRTKAKTLGHFTF